MTLASIWSANQIARAYQAERLIVSAAAWMAPQANVVVAILHTVIISVFTGALGGVAVFDPSFAQRSSGTSSGFFVLAAALTVLGGVYACVQTYNERRAPLQS